MRFVTPGLRTSAIVVLLSSLLSAGAVRAVEPGPAPCLGDCNADAEVTVDELLTMVSIALGSASVSACEAGDRDGDGAIAVDEIVVAVDHGLNGCPADRLCGGVEGVVCPAGESCEVADGMCGITALQGICTPPAEDCDTDVTAVCGCDALTYANDCARRAAHVARDHEGPCATPESAQVDALLASVGITPDKPGATVMVIRAGRVVHSSGYGLANVARQVPNTPHTIFKLASITKDFTGLAIMMLAAEGKLGYDDPIAMYLPELARFGTDVTIRHMLHHTSGFPDYYNDSGLYAQLLSRAPMPLNPDELALLAEDGRALFAPGERFAYSNTAYDMLALVIERLSGHSYDEFLQARVFGPLGMTSTFSLPNASRLADPDRGLGYRVFPTRIGLADSNPFDTLAGSASVYSTAEDLYRYDQALYTERLVSQAMLEEAFTPGRLNNGSEVRFDLSPDPDDSYGFGWELGTHGGERYAGNGGVWDGHRNYFVRFVDRQLTVVLLLNREDIDFGSLVFRIADVYLGQG